MYEIMIEDTFASAHQLRGYNGPCENMHGHTWKVQVFLSGTELDKLGMLYDFKTAKKVLKGVLEEFDHKNLNEVECFKDVNPTAENIARVIFEKVNALVGLVGVPHAAPVQIKKTVVWESEKTCATYSS